MAEKLLSALPVGDIRLHPQKAGFRLLHCLIRGDGDHVDGEHEISVQVSQLCDHAVFDIRCVLPQEQNSAVALSHLEAVLLELHRIRADRVLEAVPLVPGFADVEVKCAFFPGAVEVMNHLEAFLGVHFPADASEPGEVPDELAADAGEEAPRVVHTLLRDGDRDIFVLHDGVCARRMVEKHLIVFPAVGIEVVAPVGKQDALLEVEAVEPAVIDGDLRGGAAVEGIQQFRVFEEHRLLVRAAGDGVVDVGKLIGLGIFFLPDLKDPVVVYGEDRDRILHAPRNDELLLVLREQCFQRLNHVFSALPSLFFRCPVSELHSRCCCCGIPAFWA